MNIKITLILLFFLCFIKLDSKNPFYKRLERAEKGDYIVTEQDKNCSLLLVHEKTDSSLILEEISFLRSSKPKDYKKWLEKKAPGHLSWILYEIHLNTLKIEEAFSFSKQGWIQIGEGENLLRDFLSLSFQEISLQDRRKIGPPPKEGEPDFRKVWTPPLIREGEKVKNPSHTAYLVMWPKDTSFLSGKNLELYFDEKSPFPFWVEVKGDHLSGFVKGIDSGKNLISPHSFLPRRTPLFLEKKKKGLTVTYLMQIPSYCLPFSLFVEGKEKTPLLEKKHFLLSNKEKETYILEFFLDSLPKESFSLIMIPEKHPELSVEKTNPFG